MTAANRVYRNDDVFRIVVQHCYKSTLISLMRSEQQGTIYDCCVKELYKEIDYDLVKDMVRDTPGRCQYLDAVVHINADVPKNNKPESMVFYQADAFLIHADPCSPKAIGILRPKCPNLRLVTRHENGRSGERFTIILTKGKHTGTVRFHEQIDLIPERFNGQVRTPVITMPARWQGWIIKHTVGLGAIKDLVTREWDHDMKALLQNPNRLDKRVTEIQTGWLPFTLPELSAIAAARKPGDNPISRITSIVEVFDMDRLRQFLMMAGKDLYQLHLHTQPHPSKITLKNLPAIVRLVRSQCPKLVKLRLPLSFSLDGVGLVDGDIDHPPYDIIGPGKIRTLSILVYKLGQRRPQDLDEVLSSNFARNMACLLSPDFELFLLKGPDFALKLGCWDHTCIQSLGWCSWYRVLIVAIKFFQSLGPRLKPHFAISSLAHLGVNSIRDLKALQYHTSGEPMKIQAPTSRSFGTKRTRNDFCGGEDCEYGGDKFRDWREFDGRDDQDSYGHGDRAGGAACAQS